MLARVGQVVESWRPQRSNRVPVACPCGPKVRVPNPGSLAVLFTDLGVGGRNPTAAGLGAGLRPAHTNLPVSPSPSQAADETARRPGCAGTGTSYGSQSPLGLCPPCLVSPPSWQGPNMGCLWLGARPGPLAYLPALIRSWAGQRARHVGRQGVDKPAACSARSTQPFRPQWPEQATAGKGSPWSWVWVGGGGVTSWAAGGRMVYKPTGVPRTPSQPGADLVSTSGLGD